ncbi:MMPL family transporter [Agilicoccus flavus]|uniref:MMPL family transporter n=1 Tax=Agilicoccus flavus TaxID=2775968 RepID=UPI001CF64775|nr:MMPL family transporter [Agilicoccus flavus]
MPSSTRPPADPTAVRPVDAQTGKRRDERGPWWGLGGLVSSRAGAWVVLLLGVLLSGAVFAAGSSSSSTAPDSRPADAESSRVEALLATFPDGDVAPAIAVYSRADGGELTGADLAAAAQSRSRMYTVDRGVAGAADEGAQAAPVVPSPDRKATLAIVPVSTDRTGGDLADVVADLRTQAATGLPAGLVVQVTGGPAFGADTAGAFAGADLRLLLVTAAVVAVLLLLTYRSPVLWLVPLLVVGLADRVAQILAGHVGDGLGLSLDGSTTGITSVLVFGAGTNYALLLVSRYREELRRETDHRRALRRALRHTGPAVLASNVTVVLALATLLVAAIPSTRILGVAAATGLLVALAYAVLLLPAALAVCGRGLFWPFVPRAGDPDPAAGGGWYRLASGVARRPVLVLGITVPLLFVCALGLSGVRIGLEQTQQFRVAAQSVDGFETLRAHYPAGQVNPTTVLARTDSSAAVRSTITETPGVVGVRPTGSTADGLTRWQVVLGADPASPGAFDAVQALRDRLGAIPGAQALVGGSDAAQLDSRDAARGDLLRIVPLILGVVLLVLFALLRAVVGPLLLIAATTLSAVAAIGAGAWLSTRVFGFPGLETSVLLFSFLFLVALGVDYTIFLVTRASEEAAEHGTRTGIVRAVALTGGVITSAGVVLAAVFVVLGVLPLITLTQIGITVGIGILLDTFVVRTVVIPALFTLVGPRVWWPSTPAADR